MKRGFLCMVGCMAALLTAGCRQQAAWQVLFDGTGTDQWRGINIDTFPERGWVVEDGMLIRDPSKGGSRDIITLEQYSDFELELEFKMTERANSGLA